MNGHLYVQDLSKISDLISGRIKQIDCFFLTPDQAKNYPSTRPLIESVNVVGCYMEPFFNMVTVMIGCSPFKRQDLTCLATISGEDLAAMHHQSFQPTTTIIYQGDSVDICTLSYKQFAWYLTELWATSVQMHFDFDLKGSKVQITRATPKRRTDDKEPLTTCSLIEKTPGLYKRSILSAGFLKDGALIIACQFKTV